jgi:4-amino-4-deoxy-L-arabinose transferase-like glycosyltransferase
MMNHHTQHATRNTHPQRITGNPWPVVCSLLIVCCSFLLRLLLLNAQSIWWDEAISLHLATSTVADLLADRATHVHPPLYFLLLKGWVALAGTSGFSARFLSAWFNTLLVPAVYAFGRRYLGRDTGLIAAVLTAISSLYVVYSQEARVYALLPLIYLALLALIHRLAGFSPQEGTEKRSTWRDWFLFAGIQVVGLYTHYVVALAVVYAHLVLLCRLRRRELVRWLASTALVALLCLPWAIAVLVNRAAVLADVGAGDPFTEPLPLGFFIRLLWTFQWSGLTAAPGYPPLSVGALVLAGLFVIALASLLTHAPTRATTSRLLAHWFVPLAPTLLAWRAKPLSHPRYTALFAVALLLLAGYTLAQLGRHRSARRALALLLALALLAPSTIALRAWYFDPRFAKDDVRGLAAWLESATTAGDRIVAPWQDWSLDYAYRGPAPIIRPNPADEAATWNVLRTQTATSGCVFLVTYPRASQDRRGLLPYALESAGSLVERRSFKGLLVRVYTLDRPVGPPPVGTPADADFGPLRLTAAWVEPHPAADTALALSLSWHLEEPVTERYHLALRLHDLDGWELAADDALLLDSHALPTDDWTVGEAATTYHVLPMAPGTPPLTYTLSVGVYTADDQGSVRLLNLLDTAGNPQGQSYEIGTVALAPARGLHTDPYAVAPDLPVLSPPVTLAEGLLLEAAALDRQTVAPGQSVFVTLRWRAAAAPLPDLRPAVTLSQAGIRLAAAQDAPAGGL